MTTIIKSIASTTAAVVLVLSPAFCQEADAPEIDKKFQLTNVSFDAGFLVQYGQVLSLDQIKAVEGTFGQATDFSIYPNDQNPFSWISGSGSNFSLNWHFLKETEKRNYVWTVGATYQTRGSGSLYLSRQDETPYDTLTSSQTGEQYVIDSIYNQSYSFHSTTDILMLSTSFQLQKKFGSRMTLNHGLGLSLGVSVRDYYSKHSSSFSFIEQPSSYSNFHYEPSEQTSSTKTGVGETLTCSFNAPIGFDLTLGKKRPFFQNTMLMLNLNPGLQWYFQQSFGTYFTPTMAASLGMKFNVRK